MADKKTDLPPEELALLGTLDARIARPGDESLNAMECVERARACRSQGKIAEAVGHLYRAAAIVHQFPHAVIELRQIARLYVAAADIALACGDRARALSLVVSALECHPKEPGARKLLAQIESSYSGPDTTKHCYVFYDADRANAVHREAVRRCLEFTAISGIIGDVFEFGVLAGWTSRIFAETMRDLMIMGDLRLYDSFEGLPEYDSVIDRESWEIGGRNIWADKMKFGDDFVASLGGDLAGHIKGRLSTVIRGERIRTFPGFYSDSLRQPTTAKAALVHMDCDLYQSTVEVLDFLERSDALQDGCVVMFDDWNCNKASPWFGERRAFREFLERQDRYTSSQFFTYGFNGAAFILHDRRVAVDQAGRTK